MLQHTFLLFKGKNSLINDYRICLLICIFLTLWPILPTQFLIIGLMSYIPPIGFYLNSLSKLPFAV